ncbi:sulfatase [Fulvivirgaceae bacterium BMA12]|uniref:Sulfatase n=1 Tax=Agaribacillus aureus TaxID=3051825 RepID=A0ABT8KZA2_9BACT|nr:sulfatase [Fulvivirgaceae bacterium BMA12]
MIKPSLYFNKGLAALIILMNLLVYCCSSNPSKLEPDQQKRYNVLFLIVDDMNDYGFYHGFPKVKMPYLDAFKKTAITFERAYCASPVCTPSRAATFSGLYPHNTGAYFNGSDPWNQSELLKSVETMPECFKRNGYTTFGRGKLYHAQLEEGRIENNFDNRPLYGGGFGPFPDEDHQIKGKFWGYQSFPDSLFPDVKNAEAAIEFLKKDKDKPFFLGLGLWRPHSPFTAPQRFYDMYDIDEIEFPAGFKKDDTTDIPELSKTLLDPFGRFPVSGLTTPDKWKEMLLAYNACNSFADWSIGRVIKELDNSKYADNTIVVFWSDNGYHCGEKNHWEKNTLYEQAALTPLAIRIPGSETNGKIITAPVSLVDLYATLIDYCGLNSPKNEIDSKSLRPLLENPQANWEHPAITTFGEGSVSIRSQRYRYIQYVDGSEELYDHNSDPYEFKNIANETALSSIKTNLRRYIPKKFAKELPGRKN